MGLEIERKYLVKQEEWAKQKPERSQHLRQAYLLNDPDKTIRIRTTGDKAYLTIKGRAKGISRLEFEYEIPVNEAHELINNFATATVEKIRHYITYKGKLWEVDEFKGLNEGLWITEIELTSETEAYELPLWAAQEVSSDPRYLNARLVKHPYQQWGNTSS